MTIRLVKHDGTVSLDEIIKIARVMRPRSLSKTFAGTVKEILGRITDGRAPTDCTDASCVFAGTAQSVGCKVEGSHPHDIITQIDNGQVDVPKE